MVALYDAVILLDCYNDDNDYDNEEVQEVGMSFEFVQEFLFHNLIYLISIIYQ